MSVIGLPVVETAIGRCTGEEEGCCLGEGEGTRNGVDSDVAANVGAGED